MIGVDGLGVDLGGNRILSEVDMSVEAGEVVGLVGPNGSGKTTLLRTLYRAVRPRTGAVQVAGLPVAETGRRRLARSLAATTQQQDGDVSLSVREVVEQGRVAHLGLLEPLRAEDRRLVAEALHTVGLGQWAGRDVRTLSGGELQRVAIARALAQQPRVLVLDEPTNHLDLRHQLGVLELLGKLAADGPAVLLTLHDLRLAVAHCDRLVVLDGGRVVANGAPAEVLDERLLAEVFGVRGQLLVPEGQTRPHLHLHGTA